MADVLVSQSKALKQRILKKAADYFPELDGSRVRGTGVPFRESSTHPQVSFGAFGERKGAIEASVVVKFTPVRRQSCSGQNLMGGGADRVLVARISAGHRSKAMGLRASFLYGYFGEDDRDILVEGYNLKALVFRWVKQRGNVSAPRVQGGRHYCDQVGEAEITI